MTYQRNVLHARTKYSVNLNQFDRSCNYQLEVKRMEGVSRLVLDTTASQQSAIIDEIV